MEMGNENLGSQACIYKAGGTFGRGEEGSRGHDFGQEGVAREVRAPGSHAQCEQRQRHEDDSRRGA